MNYPPGHHEQLIAQGVFEVQRLRAENERLREVVFQQVLRHPLPWRVESDWTEEVIASDGYCIAKCKTPEDAEAIIAVARQAFALPSSREQS